MSKDLHDVYMGILASERTDINTDFLAIYYSRLNNKEKSTHYLAELRDVPFKATNVDDLNCISELPLVSLNDSTRYVSEKLSTIFIKDYKNEIFANFIKDIIRPIIKEISDVTSNGNIDNIPEEERYITILGDISVETFISFKRTLLMFYRANWLLPLLFDDSDKETFDIEVAKNMTKVEEEFIQNMDLVNFRTCLRIVDNIYLDSIRELSNNLLDIINKSKTNFYLVSKSKTLFMKEVLRF